MANTWKSNMDADVFVRQLRRDVIDGEVKLYKELLEKSEHQTASDPYWTEIRLLYASLNSEQKDTLLNIVRQVSVDVLASLLGIIDGLSYFEGASNQFRLTVHENIELSGDLQERLFMQEQDNARQG